MAIIGEMAELKSRTHNQCRELVPIVLLEFAKYAYSSGCPNEDWRPASARPGRLLCTNGSPENASPRRPYGSGFWTWERDW
jgi:hypothetical protein